MNKNRSQGHADGKKGKTKEAAGRDAGTGHPEQQEHSGKSTVKDETVLGKINDDPGSNTK
ncbi:MAG: hypothetical protein ACK4SX_03755 [Alcanivoracaceae bacterium]